MMRNLSIIPGMKELSKLIPKHLVSGDPEVPCKHHIAYRTAPRGQSFAPEPIAGSCWRESGGSSQRGRKTLE